MRRLQLAMLSGFIAACTLTYTPETILSHHTTENAPANVEKMDEFVPGRIGPDHFPAGMNPLTGQPAADPATLNRPPILAKISNAPPIVRPQAGIGSANLVYEHYAEGGLTRFSALFHGAAPDRVGSIRSARLIDYELMPMYGSLLAFSGASIGVEDRLNTSEFIERLYKGVLYGQPYYWRDEDIAIPHNMFFNPNALWELAASEGLAQAPPLNGMAFQPEAPPDAISPANTIEIAYRATRVLWEYDPVTGRYARSADGLPHFDANTETQITAANVIVLYAEHRLTDIIESQWQDSISYSIEIKLWFEGEAVIFRDGQRYEARWVRPTREDLIGFRTADGEIFYLKPGNTWIQVFPPPDQQEPEEEWVRVE